MKSVKYLFESLTKKKTSSAFKILFKAFDRLLTLFVRITLRCDVCK